MRFTFIDAAKAEFPIQRRRQVLKVSQSGYFAWRSRPACQRQRDDLVLLARVRSAFRESKGTLWQSAHDPRAPGSGLPNWAPSDGSTDVGEWAQGPAEAPLQAHHRQPSRLSDRSQPARAGLLGRAPEPEVERGYLVRVDGCGMAVAGCDPRFLCSAGGWLGGQRPAAQGTGVGGAA